MKNTLTIYGCGGAGINIANYFTRDVQKEMAGRASVEVKFFDTSYSNVDQSNEAQMALFSRIADSNIGSGGLRGENLEPIRRSMKDLLIKNQPTDINVVVFSSAGGSGSTIGPVLTQELLASDKPVIIVTFLDWSNELRTRNSFNTLRTLDNIAAHAEKPVIIYPISNEVRFDADDAALFAITQIALLFSNEHLELDNADTFNFLNYHRVTAYKPMLASLEIRTDKGKPTDLIKELEGIRPVSAAFIHTNIESSDQYKSVFTTGYSCEGFLSKENLTDNSTSVVYTIGVEEISRIRRKLDEEMKVYVDANNAAIDASRSKDEAKYIQEGITDGTFVL